MAKKKDTTLYCSFCGRSDREVELMLPGMNGCICNDCAERAVELCAQTDYAMKHTGADDLLLLEDTLLKIMMEAGR